MATPTLRKFPYPFKSMVAICSDIDCTLVDEFGQIHQFLNSDATTPEMGQGVGLDIGDTFVFYNKADSWTATEEMAYTGDGRAIDDGCGYGNEMAYWSGMTTTPKDSLAIKKYLKCGWIDAMHTYGNWNTTQPPAFVRSYAEAAVAELDGMKESDGIQVTVWVDHGDGNNTPQLMGGSGTTPATPGYHADLIRDYGFRYYWGPLRYAGASACGVSSIVQGTIANDGSKWWRFSRCCGVGTGSTISWYGTMADYLINTTTLNRLTTNGFYEVFAMHWGMGMRPHADIYTYPDTTPKWTMCDSTPFVDEVQSALRLLRSKQDAGDILVARTSRLLPYNVAQLYTQWTATGSDINITALADPQFGTHVPTVDEVRGLTWKVDSASSASITIDGVAVDESDIIRSIDSATEQYVGIAWWGYDRTDYTATDTQDTAKVGSVQAPFLTAPGIAYYDFALNLADVIASGAGSLTLDLAVAASGSAVNPSTVSGAGTLTLDLAVAGAASVTSAGSGSVSLDLAVSGIATVVDAESRAYDFAAMFSDVVYAGAGAFALDLRVDVSDQHGVKRMTRITARSAQGIAQRSTTTRVPGRGWRQ